MQVFILSKKKYVKEFTGRGASKFGSRWNSKGIEVIYTAKSRALAMAEVLVHSSLATLPTDFMMIVIETPDEVQIKSLDLKTLNKNWNSHPHYIETQKLGDYFTDSLEACILKVPSAVVKGDFNYLINPHHSEFKKIDFAEVSCFSIGKRIFQ